MHSMCIRYFLHYDVETRPVGLVFSLGLSEKHCGVGMYCDLCLLVESKIVACVLTTTDLIDDIQWC